MFRAGSCPPLTVWAIDRTTDLDALSADSGYSAWNVARPG